MPLVVCWVENFMSSSSIQSFAHTYVYNCFKLPQQMHHLQELGLNNLAFVERGAVRIERNPVLCYVNTISWATLAPHSKGDNIILVIEYL